LSERFARSAGKEGHPDHPNEIEQLLFLSSGEVAKDLNKLRRSGISAVLNCVGASQQTDKAYYGLDFEYLQLELKDEDSFDLRVFLPQCLDFIRANRDDKKRGVLVHCSAGVSRSAAVVLAYLMYEHRWTLALALDCVWQARPFVLPNKGFFDMLLAIEHEIRAGVFMPEKLQK